MGQFSCRIEGQSTKAYRRRIVQIENSFSKLFLCYLFLGFLYYPRLSDKNSQMAILKKLKILFSVQDIFNSGFSKNSDRPIFWSFFINLLFVWHKLCLSRIITLLSNSCFDSSDRMLDSCFGQNVWVRITGSEITLARQIPIISLFVESYVHKALSCAYSPSLRTGITLALKISNALLEHQLEAIM